ncbi:hypothetical protein BGZ60DRAFT_151302 [Tricladium varicosporioides]|nr:hypothetical protein BGZ60DRAFT_151302 [Hymenoscyphus varicosporioides]
MNQIITNSQLASSIAPILLGSGSIHLPGVLWPCISTLHRHLALNSGTGASVRPWSRISSRHLQESGTTFRGVPSGYRSLAASNLVRRSRPINSFTTTSVTHLPRIDSARDFSTSSVAMTHDRNNIIEVVRQSPPVDTTEPYDARWVAGKTILITGGASGFGEGMLRKWAENGANIVIGDVNDARGKALVEEVRKATGSQHHHYLHCDVTNWQSQVDFFRDAAKLSPHGSIDGVVANAGVGDGSPWLDDPPATVETLAEPPPPKLQCIQVNLIGVMYTAHLAMHYLPKKPSADKVPASLGPGPYTPDAHLLLVGSVASLAPLPTQIQYAASKHGVLGIFRSMRSTSFQRGVRVNMICPYFIDTPILPAAARVLLAGGAMGKPEDVVDAATRLMADSRIVGRALAIGPKVNIDGEWQLVNNKTGKETAIWETYADDFEEVDAFTSRLIRMLNQVERARGWGGWAKDMVLAIAYPFRSWWRG